MSQDLASFGGYGFCWFFRNSIKVGQEMRLSYYCLCWKCPNKAYAKSKQNPLASWEWPQSKFSSHLRHIEALLNSFVKTRLHLEAMDFVDFSGIQSKLVKWCGCPITACAGNVPIKHMPKANKAPLPHDSDHQANFQAIWGILRHYLTPESRPGFIWMLWILLIFQEFKQNKSSDAPVLLLLVLEMSQ